MKRILCKLLDILKLLVVALLVLAALWEIVWYIASADLREIEKKNKADPVYQKVMSEVEEKERIEKDRQKKLDKLNDKQQKEEKAKLDFEKRISGKYTRDSLLNKISSDQKIAERLVVVGGYDCMNYWYTSHNWDDDICFDELSFFVFKNNKTAKKAFNAMKDGWIERETDRGENYIQGWEAGVQDADVEVFIYLTDNMIVTAELQVVSSWAEPVDEGDSNSTASFYYRKEFIEDNF